MSTAAERRSFHPPMEAYWHEWISVAAYFRAQQRGFAPGHSLDDWLLAEQDVKGLIQAPTPLPPEFPNEHRRIL